MEPLGLGPLELISAILIGIFLLFPVVITPVIFPTGDYRNRWTSGAFLLVLPPVIHKN